MPSRTTLLYDFGPWHEPLQECADTYPRGAQGGKDKEHGAMSVCDECLDVYKRRYDIKRVIVVNIAPRK